MSKSMNPDGASRAMELRPGDVIAGTMVLDAIAEMDGFGDEVTEADRRAAWCRPWVVTKIIRYYDDPSQVDVQTARHGLWGLPSDLVVTVYNQPDRK